MTVDLESSKGLMEWVMGAGVRRPDWISSPDAIEKNMIFLDWDGEKNGGLLVNMEAEDSLERLAAGVSRKWLSSTDPMEAMKVFKLSTESGRTGCLNLLRESFPA